jgi:membrane protein required for beta-lactamase induction
MLTLFTQRSKVWRLWSNQNELYQVASASLGATTTTTMMMMMTANCCHWNWCRIAFGIVPLTHYDFLVRVPN